MDALQFVHLLKWSMWKHQEGKSPAIVSTTFILNANHCGQSAWRQDVQTGTSNTPAFCFVIQLQWATLETRCRREKGALGDPENDGQHDDITLNILTVWGRVPAHPILRRSQRRLDWQVVWKTLHPMWRVVLTQISIILKYKLFNLHKCQEVTVLNHRLS